MTNAPGLRSIFAVAAAVALVVPRLARADASPPEDKEKEADKELVLEYGGTSHVFVRLPKGRLTQGSPASEAGREADEAPRPVTLTRDVWMGQHLVSRGDFAAFVADARYMTEAERGTSGGHGWDGKTLVQKKEFTWRNPGFPQTDDHPVVLVTWGDANAYAAWVARKIGRRVRLPTEAEWEYAARAGTTTPWYAGATETDALSAGWFKAHGPGTHPRGQKGPNPFGLFDMSGNVYEWCRDVYAPYGKEPTVDPEQTTGIAGEPERRVLRGGSWMRDPKRGRSAARYRATPGTRNAENGFRLVVTDEESLAPGVLGGTTRSGAFATAAPLGLGDGGASDAPDEDEASEEREGGGGGWALLLAPAAAAGGVVVWLAMRRRRSAGASGFETRPADDGFYVRAPASSRRARIRYECVVSGTVVSDVVPLDGADETFVYTGGRPAAIRVLEVVAVDGSAGYRQASPAPNERHAPAPREAPSRKADAEAAAVVAATWTSDTSTTSTSSDTSEPFAGTPNAY